MRTTIIHCDVCRTELKSRGWENEPALFSVVSNCTSQNPLGQVEGFKDSSQSIEIKFPDVCQTCQHHLATIIAATINAIRSGKATPP